MNEKSCSNCIECEEYGERCTVHNMPIPCEENERKWFAKDCESYKKAKP
jgi:hypothetical protein